MRRSARRRVLSHACAARPPGGTNRRCTSHHRHHATRTLCTCHRHLPPPRSLAPRRIATGRSRQEAEGGDEAGRRGPRHVFVADDDDEEESRAAPTTVRTDKWGRREQARPHTSSHTRPLRVCTDAVTPSRHAPCAPPRRLSAGYATRRRMQRHDTLHRYARFHPHHPLNQTPSSLVLISRARRCSLQVLPVLLGSARTHARDGDRSVQASLPGLRGRERDRVREMRRHGTVHRRRVCTHSIGTL